VPSAGQLAGIEDDRVGVVQRLVHLDGVDSWQTGMRVAPRSVQVTACAADVSSVQGRTRKEDACLLNGLGDKAWMRRCDVVDAVDVLDDDEFFLLASTPLKVAPRSVIAGWNGGAEPKGCT
jgi:hypothetical protein